MMVLQQRMDLEATRLLQSPSPSHHLDGRSNLNPRLSREVYTLDSSSRGGNVVVDDELLPLPEKPGVVLAAWPSEPIGGIIVTHRKPPHASQASHLQPQAQPQPSLLDSILATLCRVAVTCPMVSLARK